MSDFEAVLEPQIASGALHMTSLGQPLLLTLRFAPVGNEDNHLDMVAVPLMFRITAPYPLAVECPPPRLPAKNTAEYYSLVDAWEAWMSPGSKIEYPYGTALDGNQATTSMEENCPSSQLLALLQQPMMLQECIRVGWRGVGSLEASGGQRSAVSLMLRGAVPVTRPIVLPLLARLVDEESGRQAAITKT